MAQLPVNRTTSNTPADHIADHNEIHRLHDILDGSAGPSQALATLDGRYQGALNLRSYVVGDGVANDAAGYQSAIAAALAAGRPLYHPGGLTCYLGSTILNVPSGSTIVGDGYTSLLISDAPSGVGGSSAYACMQNTGWAADTAVSNILVSSLRFRRTTTLAGNEGPYDAGIRFRNALANVTVKDCTIEGFGAGVVMEGGTDWGIRNCVGYCQSDTAIRVPNGGGGAGALACQRGVVDNCWAINSGYALDGVTPVPSPNGPLGSAFIVTQSGARLQGCGTVNPRKNSIETGSSQGPISIIGFKVYVDIAGRVGDILIADTHSLTLQDIVIELHNGGAARINVTGTIGVSGNGIGQVDITIDGVSATNDYQSAGFAAVALNVSGSVSNVRVSNVVARGMGIVATGAAVVGAFVDCAVYDAPAQGFYFGTGLLDVRRCRAINCGADSSLVGTVRTGFTFDTMAAGSWTQNLRADDTRAGGARTQQYGFYLNAGTVTWNFNEASNNVLGSTTTTNSPQITPGSYLPPIPGIGAGVYGDGSDGSPTFDGIATILGMVPSSNVYTMTRDLFLFNPIINSGVTVKDNCYRLFVAGTLTNNGILAADGVNAAGAVAGAVPPVGSIAGTSVGGAGGAGGVNAGTAGGNIASNCLCGWGGAGGAGGTGAAGAAGTATGQSSLRGSVRSLPTAILGQFVNGNNALERVSTGGGGGGGGGDGTNSGGGGGGAGNLMILVVLTFAGVGVIHANGGAGANGVAGNAGGGGGGTGGAIIIVSSSVTAGSLTITGQTITATGGLKGNGVGTGANGNNGVGGSTILIPN